MVKLELDGTSRDEILEELASLLCLEEKWEKLLLKSFKRRQDLGSTGMGRGVAVVYGRSQGLSRLRVGFGRKRDGIDFNAIDGKPVHYFFLLVAPMVEQPNELLPWLARICLFAKERDALDRLAAVQGVDECLALLDELSILPLP